MWLGRDMTEIEIYAKEDRKKGTTREREIFGEIQR